jgi:hypothetical protein
MVNNLDIKVLSVKFMYIIYLIIFSASLISTGNVRVNTTCMLSQRPVTIHLWAGNQMSFKGLLVPELSLGVSGQFIYDSHICLESQPGIDTQHSKKTQQKIYQ